MTGTFFRKKETDKNFITKIHLLCFVLLFEYVRKTCGRHKCLIKIHTTIKPKDKRKERRDNGIKKYDSSVVKVLFDFSNPFYNYLV